MTKYIKLTEFWGEIDILTVAVGDLRAPLSELNWIISICVFKFADASATLQEFRSR